MKVMIIAGLLVLRSHWAVAQEQPVPSSLFYPHPMAAGQWAGSVGITLLTVPRDIAEEQINKAPALDLRAAVGLPWQCSVNAGATIQYITNHFQFGGKWSHRIGRIGISCGDDAAYWFGFMTLEGFDNKMYGWINYPNISVGYDFGEVQLTLKGEAILVMFLKSFAGENDLGTGKNTLAGGAVTLMLEQPFWKKTRVLLGARLALTEFHHQTWFAFSTFERRLLFSELVFGFIL